MQITASRQSYRIRFRREYRGGEIAVGYSSHGNEKLVKETKPGQRAPGFVIYKPAEVTN